MRRLFEIVEGMDKFSCESVKETKKRDKYYCDKGCDLHYFRVAKQLNDKYHDELVGRKLHFRGNINSYSLISLDIKTPELGISGLKTFKQGEIALKIRIDIILKGPGRSTPEKELQAFIIEQAIKDEHNKLPFGDNLTFLTSEMAFASVFVESKNKDAKLVNDVLAIDNNGTLWVIELKSSSKTGDGYRLKDQVNDFKRVIIDKRPLFKDLVLLLTDRKREWNDYVSCMVVWPQAERPRTTDWGDIVEIRYKPKFTFSKVPLVK